MTRGYDMTARTDFEAASLGDWGTLSDQAADIGCRGRETRGSFRHNALAEDIMKFLGIGIILFALGQWVSPDFSEVDPAGVTQTLLSIAFSLIGLAVYVFATRGSRNEIAIDYSTGEVCIARLDRQDRVRGIRRIPASQIKSLYVCRSETPGEPAKLRIRLFGTNSEVTALRGEVADIEILHHRLCRALQVLESDGVMNAAQPEIT